MSRKECPICGGKNTEFIQLADGSEETVVTTREEVGDGLLELRTCNDCPATIENVLTVEKARAEVVET